MSLFLFQSGYYPIQCVSSMDVFCYRWLRWLIYGIFFFLRSTFWVIHVFLTKLLPTSVHVILQTIPVLSSVGDVSFAQNSLGVFGLLKVLQLNANYLAIRKARLKRGAYCIKKKEATRRLYSSFFVKLIMKKFSANLLFINWKYHDVTPHRLWQFHNLHTKTCTFGTVSVKHQALIGCHKPGETFNRN